MYMYVHIIFTKKIVDSQLGEWTECALQLLVALQKKCLPKPAPRIYFS